ncbi:hypothetical protein Tcan_00874, partial [Toxocara canis]
MRAIFAHIDCSNGISAFRSLFSIDPFIFFSHYYLSWPHKQELDAVFCKLVCSLVLIGVMQENLVTYLRISRMCLGEMNCGGEFFHRNYCNFWQSQIGTNRNGRCQFRFYCPSDNFTVYQ